MAAALAAFLLTQYGWAARAPFLNDDHVFLDLTRGASFAALWRPNAAVAHWWRPWSRELHYWTFQRLFGTDPLPYHLASFALWLGVMALYFTLARRLAGARAAVVSTAAVAALAAWGLPLTWVAGVQDLWMLLWALACLHAVARGRAWAAAAATALALLSKETAALLPAVALALALAVERTGPRAALRRVWPLGLVTVAWAVLHPMLLGWLWQPLAPAGSAAAPGGAPVIAGRTLLALVNLEGPLAPERGWAQPLPAALAGVAILGGLVAWALLAPRVRGRAAGPGGRALAAIAVTWAAAGWAPLLMPALGWHAYYALFGMLGAWLLAGAWLARRPAPALAAVALLAALGPVHAATPSRDWGDAWYQRRAAEFVDFMRRDLARLHPRFPPHSRLWFRDVPSNVGFITGDAPALRVWYGDPTLRGGLFGAFRARAAGAPPGPDWFFRYDSTAGWVELLPAGEDTAWRARDPRWRTDHEILAVTLARGGDWAATAVAYATLARAFPGDADYPYYAGLAALAQGDSAAAGTWLVRAAALPSADAEIRAAARPFARGPSRAGSRPRAGATDP